MPDAITIPDVRVTGTWSEHTATLAGALVLDERGASLLTEREEAWPIAPYSALTDATWADGTLTLYRNEERLALTGSRDLNRAWGVIVERACTLPEMTRGLRSLGTARGGSTQLQSRFFGPLLLARRRLQEPEPIEWRVSRFDAAALSARLTATIAELALERYPQSPPDRRAFEAVLEEALEPLSNSLAALAGATGHIGTAGEGRRFVAWRAWTRQLRRVFLEADRAWTSMTHSLQQAP